MRTAILLVAGLLALPATSASAQRRIPQLSGGWVMRDSTAWPSPASDSAAQDTVRDTTSIFYDVPLAGGATMHVRRSADPDPRWVGYQQYQLLRGMAAPVRAFTIEQTDSSVNVTNEGGFSYTVYPGGRKTIIPLNDSVSVEARAKWDDDALVVEYRPTGGGKVTETYHLADSRQYLRLEVRVEYKKSEFLYGPFWRARMYRRSETPGS